MRASHWEINSADLCLLTVCRPRASADVIVPGNACLPSLMLKIKASSAKRERLWPNNSPIQPKAILIFLIIHHFPRSATETHTHTYTYTVYATSLALVTHSHYISRQITLGSSRCCFVGNSVRFTNDFLCIIGQACLF